MSREDALCNLLHELFDFAGLRRWLESVPSLASVADEVPDAAVGQAELIHKTLGAMKRQGVVDEVLFLALVKARPRRLADIQRVAKLWGVALRSEQIKPLLPSDSPDALAVLPRPEQVEALEALLVERERHLRDGQVSPDLGARIDALVRGIMDGARLKSGDEVAGARLIKPVGNGNFGTIWLAEGLKDREELAVKVFHLEKLAEGVMLWRFRRSITAMRRLAEDRRAPRTIARLHAVAPDTLAFSMPYLKGGNLEDTARRGWTLSFKLEIFLEICHAVDFAHKVGIIHRDIKPANVVMDADNHPVLTDFDISDIKFATKLSTAGGLGTPIFAAPEQVEKGDQADERSDIYSLGRLLYFLLLERSPGYQDERDPTLANLSRFPAALVAVVRRATQWEPHRRYPDVASLVGDVEQCMSGAAAAKAHLRRGARWVRYNWALLLIAGLVSGGSLGGFLLQKRAADVERKAAEDATQAAERERAAAAEQARLRQQLSDALASIKDLSDQVESISRRGTEIVTLIAGLKNERDALVARRDNPGLSQEDRAALAAQITAKETAIASLEAEQKENAARLAAVKADLQAETDRAAQAEQGAEEPVTELPELPPAEEMKKDLRKPSSDRQDGECVISPSGGPSGESRTALEGTRNEMRFIGLKEGQYCMGSPEGEGNSIEHPQHAVRVSAFYIGRSEVTQAQWRAVVTARQAAGDADANSLVVNPSRFKGDTLPVEQVSWCDAARFANALSSLERLEPAYTVGEDCENGGAVAWNKDASGYRLPTEAEWEYAARAGTTTDYATGDSEADLARAGWYSGNSGRQTHPVCTAEVKPWGLCDLHGNVWEWTWDWYDSGYYARSPASDPTGPAASADLGRVRRGGAWNYSPGSARSAYRLGVRPSDSWGYVGFRLVRPVVVSEPGG